MTPHELFEENKLLAENLTNKIYRTQGRFYPLADREDFQNTALLALWEACLGFDDSRGFEFSTYAYPIIWGRLQDSLRTVHPHGKAARQQEETTKNLTRPSTYALRESDRITLPDTSLDDVDEVNHLLSQLRERDREVLWLHEVEELSCSEIGGQLGISKEMARRISNRAKKQIREVA